MVQDLARALNRAVTDRTNGGDKVIAALMAMAWIGAAPADPSGPSFRCTGSLSPTETLICGDPELSAYDRAMALAWSQKWGRDDWSAARQREWLKERDQCGTDRACVLEKYQGWVSGLNALDSNGPWLDRAGRPADGSALMLGSLQSPRGSVDALNESAQLSIVTVGPGWYVFRAFGNYIYDPHDGRGPNLSDSAAVGMVHLENGKGSYADGPTEEAGTCAIDFIRLRGGGWRLEENGGCGGLGSSLSGTYRP